jgi:hypothetical protein
MEIIVALGTPIVPRPGMNSTGNATPLLAASAFA